MLSKVEANSQRHSLFQGLTREPLKFGMLLDFDGTLIDIAPHPEQIHIPEGLSPLLQKLHVKLGGRLAIVSGRSVETIRKYLPGISLLIVGQHGAESTDPRWPFMGNREIVDSFFQKSKKLQNLFPGLFIEMKGLSLAYHFRSNPEIKEHLYEHLSILCRSFSPNLLLHNGKVIFEITHAGISKANAVRILRDDTLFKDSCLIYAGDDEPDKLAIREVQAQGGSGIWIGHDMPEAHVIFENPGEFRKWLAFIEAKISDTHDIGIP